MDEIANFEPAEVFSLAEYLCEEMGARGWTTEDAAIRMGGTPEEIARKLLKLDIVLCVQKDNMVLTDDFFEDLGRAFDVSPELFRNLDATWRKWPDRRFNGFVMPDHMFGPISRRSMIRSVQ
ncbi:hypothetical protein [Mesorhizobium sp. M0088]|uniref:hypothetical protein n=1 Tax=Mesorhizobium sp. M0088 TaxID=2956873 RepID=UPI003337BDD5